MRTIGPCLYACFVFADELGGTSPLQLLQDDFESSDQEIRLKALKRVKLVADVLGPEVTRSELIPFINSECLLEAPSYGPSQGVVMLENQMLFVLRSRLHILPYVPYHSAEKENNSNGMWRAVSLRFFYIRVACLSQNGMSKLPISLCVCTCRAFSMQRVAVLGTTSSSGVSMCDAHIVWS